MVAPEMMSKKKRSCIQASGGVCTQCLGAWSGDNCTDWARRTGAPAWPDWALMDYTAAYNGDYGYTTVGPCSNYTDCFGNGECVNGECLCDQGWCGVGEE